MIDKLDTDNRPSGRQGLGNEFKKTLQLGWPMMLGNLTQIMLGMMDGAMVGSLHSSQLAAASLVSNVLMVPLILCVGVVMALPPLVAKALGEADRGKPLSLMFNSLYAGLALAAALAVVAQLGAGGLNHLGQDAVVAGLAQPYLIVMTWRLIPLVLFMGFKGFVNGLGHTRVAMYLSLASLPLNALLNYVLIFGKWGAPRLELLGAGIGTLLTQLLVVVAAAIYLFTSPAFAPYRQAIRQQLAPRKDLLREIFRLGIPTGVMFALETAAFAFTGIMAGWLGYQQQAAHQIGMYVSSLTFVICIGISAAGSIRVGYVFGKKEWGAIHRLGTTTLILASIYGFFCIACFIVFRFQIPLLFNNEPLVLEYGATVLVMVALFQLSDAVQNTSSGLLRGIQDVRVPTYLVMVAYWVVGIPVGYVLAFPLGWGIGGLWAGLIVGLTVSAILLTFRFFKMVSANRQTLVAVG